MYQRMFPRVQGRTLVVQEQKTVMRKCKKKEDTHFTLKGDASKAHRRVQCRGQAHGYQSCVLDNEEERYMHQMGTFGIGSAAYQWSRLAGAISREALLLIFQH